MRNTRPALIIFALTGLLHSCISLLHSSAQPKEKTTITISYPQPVPDSTAVIFLPNLVSKDSLDFNAAFSPDGKSFYFSRSKNRQSKIYVSHHDGVTWMEPVLATFTGETQYADADPAFGPDGKLYFISNRLLIIFTSSKRDDSFGGADLYCSKPAGNKQWLPAVNLGKNFNTKTREFCPYFTPDSNYFFFSSEGDVKWVDIDYLKKQITKLW